MIYDVDVSILYFVFCVCSINLLVQCSMLIAGVVHFFVRFWSSFSILKRCIHWQEENPYLKRIRHEGSTIHVG